MKNPQSAIRNPQSFLSPLDYAYGLLTRRAYSEQELTNKLLAKGFTEAVVTRTVERLTAQGYLDDARLAADQAERLRERGFGAEAIKAKLAQKGLSSDETVGHTGALDHAAEEMESARRLLASRFSADALKQPQTYARAFRLLLRRGYAQELVERVLGTAPSDTWETEEKE
jgi:regulatory protein